MNSFLIRRLAPFFIFTLAVEVGTFCLMALIRSQAMDWALISITDTLGILLLTTLVSFLYMMIPYVLYLLVLPARLVGSRVDKAITTGGYTVYVFMTMWEEIFSFIYWKEYGSALDQNAVGYLEHPQDTLLGLYQEFPMIEFALGVLISTALVVWLTRRFLMTKLPMPSFGRKLFHSVLYATFCLLAFRNIDIDKIEQGNNYFNNELAKEGTYSLFSSIWNARNDQPR